MQFISYSLISLSLILYISENTVMWKSNTLLFHSGFHHKAYV